MCIIKTAAIKDIEISINMDYKNKISYQLAVSKQNYILDLIYIHRILW